MALALVEVTVVDTVLLVHGRIVIFPVLNITIEMRIRLPIAFQSVPCCKYGDASFSQCDMVVLDVSVLPRDSDRTPVSGGNRNRL